MSEYIYVYFYGCLQFYFLLRSSTLFNMMCNRLSSNVFHLSESYLDLSAQDLEFGFNETRRDRILRTYVRNAYYFHLNEIFSTLKNEYTDWDRPVQNPLNVRDATLEVSDCFRYNKLIL